MNTVKKIKMKKYNIDCHSEDGSGATVSINPIAFLIVENEKVRLLPVNHTSCLDKILDYVPDLLERLGKTACQLKEECSENKKQKLNSSKEPKSNEENLNDIHNVKKKEFNNEISDELEELFEYDDD